SYSCREDDNCKNTKYRTPLVIEAKDCQSIARRQPKRLPKLRGVGWVLFHSLPRTCLHGKWRNIPIVRQGCSAVRRLLPSKAHRGFSYRRPSSHAGGCDKVRVPVAAPVVLTGRYANSWRGHQLPGRWDTFPRLRGAAACAPCVRRP